MSDKGKPRAACATKNKNKIDLFGKVEPVIARIWKVQSVEPPLSVEGGGRNDKGEISTNWWEGPKFS